MDQLGHLFRFLADMEHGPAIKEISTDLHGSNQKTVLNNMDNAELKKLFQSQGVYQVYKENDVDTPHWQTLQQVILEKNGQYDRYPSSTSARRGVSLFFPSVSNWNVLGSAQLTFCAFILLCLPSDQQLLRWS